MLESSGFTAIPNDFLDQIAPTLTAAELRIALYIYRHTIGYQKLTDAISYSQFTDGITTNDGRKLDAGAGVSRRSLPVALAGLERRGVISRSGCSSGGAVRYTIVRPASPAPAATSLTPAAQNLPVAELQTGQPGQNLPVPGLQVGQNLPPTIQTESKIKPDRAAVNLIIQEIAGISTNQAENLVSTAISNQRDISYIQRLVGYVASVAGNPAAMLTTLIKTNQDRTILPGHSASHNINRRKSDLPGYDWTLKKPTATPRQPIDFSKPFYQRIIAQQNNSASASHSEDIE